MQILISILQCIAFVSGSWRSVPVRVSLFKKETSYHCMSSPKRKRMWGSSSSSSKKTKRKSSSKMPFDEKATEKLFAELADEEDPTVIEMDGIATLCEKLDIDPETDIRILVLLWKLGSNEKPAQISKEEFMSGCYEHQLDSVEKFKGFLPQLDTGFLDQEEFKSFYKVSWIGVLFSVYRSWFHLRLCLCAVGISWIRLSHKIFYLHVILLLVLLSVQSWGNTSDAR